MSHDAKPEDLPWEMYKSLVAQSEHFNGLESTYRTLASTWLLAAFGGIGFILKDVPDYAGLLVAAVSAAAAAGIFLLWLMDLMVYHRLLGAVFAVQGALEDRHPWLPQTAHGMMRAHDNAGVVPKIVWFYVVSYLILVGIASVALVRHLGSEWNAPAQAAATILCIVLLGGGVGLYMYVAATRKTEEHEAFQAARRRHKE